jgi:hypothetical protein
VCDLYASDGLYVIDSTQHSPIIGYAYDGFPIYGAYGYKNTDGTGGIVRMKSSYALRNITSRTTNAAGATVTAGPIVSTTYPLGYFREDYQYNPTSASTPDYLDIHNGRICVTPEYPSGMYCYFATVNENWNSAYPYIVGPTFYGTKTAVKVTSITETVQTYTSTVTQAEDVNASNLNLLTYPNPADDLLAIQWKSVNKQNSIIELFDMQGKLIQTTTMNQGSSVAYFDTRSLYDGEYIVRMAIGNQFITKNIIIQH